jgi:hypothetical protein
MAIHIERRKFLATLGGAAVAWPLVAPAQQPARVPRIGIVRDAPMWHSSPGEANHTSVKYETRIKPWIQSAMEAVA